MPARRKNNSNRNKKRKESPIEPPPAAEASVSSSSSNSTSAVPNPYAHLQQPWTSPGVAGPANPYAWMTPPGWGWYPPGASLPPTTTPSAQATPPVQAQQPDALHAATFAIPLQPSVTPLQPQSSLPEVSRSIEELQASVNPGERARSKTPQPEESQSRASSSRRSRSHSPASRASESSRVRVSNRRPVHSFVEGAMVGREVFKVPRQQPLRPLETDRAAANRRYLLIMKDIISRSERLSVETDCWMIICAQNPGGGPMIHFTSDRIRRDAMDDATKIVEDFHNMAYALNIAKRKEAQDIQKLYQEKTNAALKEAELAKETAAHAEEERLAMSSQLRAQSMVLEQLQAKLNLLTGSASI